MLFLRRDQAPFSAKAWEEIDEEAVRTLRLHLASRKLLDFVGPKGWNEACVNLGRLERSKASGEEVEIGVRRVQPMLELRVPFTLKRAELEAVDRGCPDPDLDPVIDASKRLATAEGRVIFDGHGPTKAPGLVATSPHDPLELGENPETIPGVVADAIAVLRAHGIEGPYGIALGLRAYTGLVQAPAAGGYPVLDRLRNVLSAPVIWAPALDGAVVVSMRGGDFELHVGQDASIGYDRHDDKTVGLYLVETVTFLNLTPEAAVGLRHP